MIPNFKDFAIHELSIKPLGIHLHIPPIVWKGDRVGHVGINDVFFWVLEGECFFNIDSQCFLVRPGQLAYLPKGKMRSYTQASKSFCMYEIAFSAEANGQNLMELLQLTEGDYVVDIAETEEMSRLFETSVHREMHKNHIHDLARCANIINIIRMYIDKRSNNDSSKQQIFIPVLEYMEKNLEKTITTEDLASLVYMQPTYFIRRFKEVFHMPPIAYLSRLRLSKAMELLSTTSQSIEQVSQSVGIADTSYFARFFKKGCGLSPSEYRNAFRQ